MPSHIGGQGIAETRSLSSAQGESGLLTGERSSSAQQRNTTEQLEADGEEATRDWTLQNVPKSVVSSGPSRTGTGVEETAEGPRVEVDLLDTILGCNGPRRSADKVLYRPRSHACAPPGGEQK